MREYVGQMQTSFVPVHHPAEELLHAYAAGTVTGARALIVATHLVYCPQCRAQVSAVESVGGEILDREDGHWAGECPDAPAAVPGSPALVCTGPDIDFAPRHLRTALEGSQGKWNNVWFGVKELPIPHYGGAARLLWIPKGRRMPRHDHFGEEMTLVLTGSFSDATGRYRTGDFQTGAPGLDHQPWAGKDGPCVCLVVEQGGLKLSGWLGRLVEWRGGQSGTRAA